MKRWMYRVLVIAFLISSALSMSGCNATVGVGVSMGYPGPWGYGPYGGWGSTVYVGGPIYP